MKHIGGTKNEHFGWLFFLFILIIAFTAYYWRPKKDPSTSLTDQSYRSIPVDTFQVAMSNELDETSGLIVIDGQFWTINDSGNRPVLYSFDPNTGQVVSRVRIKGIRNVDWEAIASDQEYIYLADFGNNLGRRKNLQIHKLSIDDLIHMGITQGEVSSEQIFFHYPDQERFPGTYKHNFDAEALITVDDSLYVFTKNWLDNKCKIYALPKQPGSYEARYIEEFDTKGLITAATINNKANDIFLLGYNFQDKIQPFVWQLSNYQKPNFFSGTVKRINLELNRQTEAMTYRADSILMITAEKGRFPGPSLYGIRLSDL